MIYDQMLYGVEIKGLILLVFILITRNIKCTSISIHLHPVIFAYRLSLHSIG